MGIFVCQLVRYVDIVSVFVYLDKPAKLLLVVLGLVGIAYVELQFKIKVFAVRARSGSDGKQRNIVIHLDYVLPECDLQLLVLSE